MKVLMLGWELPPHHSGGLGVACYDMCKQLSDSNVDIDFILPYNAEHNIRFMNVIPAYDQSVEVFKWAGGTYDSEIFTSKKASRVTGFLDLRKQHDLFAHNVAKLCKYAEFDIIHAHDWLTFKAGIAAKLVSGKPLIVHVHATQFDQSAGNKGNPEVREIELAGLRMADKIFAVSQYTKDVIIREYGIDQDKIKVVHNGIKICAEEEINDSSNLHKYLETMKENGYSVVGSIGRKTIQKGLSHLLEAAKKVIEVNPKILFLLAGGGEQEEELIRHAAYLGISKNVIFEGWVNGKSWKDTFRISDVFMLPSVSEPFGLTALEAIGYGTPVIVSNQSGVAEVIQNCFKVDFWDVELMADMILTLVSNKSLSNVMWRNSYNEYLQQSWEKSSSIMNNTYHNVTGVA